MRLVICAAPVAKAGAGHLGRAIAVAEEAATRGWPVRLVRDPGAPTWLTSLAEASGARLIDPGPPAELLRADGDEVLLVDGYAFDRRLRTEVHARGGRLVNIEDGAYGRRPADLVIDPGLGAEQSRRPDDGSALVLRGADFALIRRAVREVVRAPAAPGSGAASRILVVMGGTDAAQLTAEVAGIVAGLGPATHPETARGTELPDQLGSVDAVVSAAGVTALEAVVIGTPLALIQVADNQARNYAELIRTGHAIGLGGPDRIRQRPADVAEDLRRLLRGDVAFEATPLVDGRGAGRLCDAIGALARA